MLGDLDLIFFPQFYEVMIFTNVFSLIASFSISDRFEFVFRNAGFVISTVLLRFSLTSPKPLDIAVAWAMVLWCRHSGDIQLLLLRITSTASGRRTADKQSRQPDGIVETCS